MKRLMIGLLLVPAFGIVVVGQDGGFFRAFRNQGEKFEVTASVAELRHCKNRDLIMTSSVIIRNVSSSPIVFCRECMSIGSTFISRNAQDLNDKKFVYDITGMGFSKKFDSRNASPDVAPFQTLAPGEQTSIRLAHYLDNFRDRESILRPGTYAARQIIRTWTSFSELEPEVVARWQQQGLTFWSDDILTPPMTVRIEHNPAKSTCE